MPSFKDLTGQKFGRWTVLKFDHIDELHRTFWKCICDCNNKRVVVGQNLKSGTSKSCGCLSNEIRKISCLTHGNSRKNNRSKEYTAWASAKTRCYNKNTKGYCNYGGRGIIMCNSWINSFEEFLKDMGKCPEGHTLERKNNNKGYNPENCTWATRKVQANNNRRCHLITFDNKTLNKEQWANLIGISRNTFCSRLRNGWTMEEIINTPVRKWNRNKDVYN